MKSLETNLKAAGAFGALIFILYCLNISFLPSEVSLGDVIPLLLLLAQFSLSLAWYVLLFALAGALFWNVAKLIYFLGLPIRILSSLVLFAASRLRTPQVRPHLRNYLTRAIQPFPIKAHPALALVGLFAFLLLMNAYLRRGFGISLPAILPTTQIQAAIFIFGCMYLFVVLHHFATFFAPAFLRRQIVATSPSFYLFPNLFLHNPRHANAKLVSGAVVALLLCFPGGYSGLLALSAMSAGLRAEDAVLVLQKASTYSLLTKTSNATNCAFYSAEKNEDLLNIRGATLLFHGIGKKSLMVLPAFPEMKIVEVRSEDLRLVNEPFSRSTSSDVYWFKIYSMLNSVDMTFHRAPSRMVSAFISDEDLVPVFRAVEMFVPTPSSIADSLVSGSLECILKSFTLEADDAVISISEHMAAELRRLGKHE